MYMKKYLIYKTTNLKTGKYYIGAHETEEINDGYLGSGIILKKLLKSMEKNHFQKKLFLNVKLNMKCT